jgi:divalent metal cation (Fe/Co/Zn/Cd) transporter
VQFIRRAKAPELPVVLLEDFAALIGLVLALAGVGLTLATDDGRWDGAGTVCIGVLLVCVAVVLAIETKSLLLGEGATAESVGRIEAALLADTSVLRVIHMKTMHLGPEELLVAAKIAVPPTDSATEVARVIDAAEARVRAAEPIARVIYLEPDIDHGVAGPGDGPVD